MYERMCRMYTRIVDGDNLTNMCLVGLYLRLRCHDENMNDADAVADFVICVRGGDWNFIHPGFITMDCRRT